MGGLDVGDGSRPELGPGWVKLAAPGAKKDVLVHQHGHVAAHAVTVPGHCQQGVRHGPPRVGPAVVQLHCVGPAAKVGVPAVGENPPLAASVAAKVVARLPGQPGRAALHQAFGVLRQPGVVYGQVIGHKIEDEAQAKQPQPLAQSGQFFVAAQCRVHPVTIDGVRRTDHVLWGVIWQRPAVFGLQARVLLGDLAAARAALPHSHEPQGVKTIARQPLQLGLGHVTQGHRPPGFPAQVVQPDPGIDLVDNGIGWPVAHSIPLVLWMLSGYDNPRSDGRVSSVSFSQKPPTSKRMPL